MFSFRYKSKTPFLHYRIGQQAVVNIQTLAYKRKYSKEIIILRQWT